MSETKPGADHVTGTRSAFLGPANLLSISNLGKYDVMTTSIVIKQVPSPFKAYILTCDIQLVVRLVLPRYNTVRYGGNDHHSGSGG